MAVAFLASRALYILSGIRFDAAPLGWYWQYLDEELLKNDLLHSLLYLHSQPPLFNLFLGLVLKVGGENATLVLQIAYMAMGLVLYWSVFSVQVGLGIGRSTAFLTSTVFALSPSCVLYENWLFYTYPLATLLCLSALCLGASLRNRGSPYFFGFFLLLFVIGGIRSIFHYSYFLVVGCCLVAICRDRRRQILFAAALPCALLLSLFSKNLVVFGSFSTSSWMGMNAWTMSTRNIPFDLRERLVQQGKLSDLSLIGRFSPSDAYPAEFFEVEERFRGIPAVAHEKKTNGRSNFNHVGYIAVSEQYMQDAIRGLLDYPAYFFVGLARSSVAYFKSTSDYVPLEGNRLQIPCIRKLYNYLLYAKLPYDLSRIEGLPIYSDRSHYLYLSLLLGLPLLILYGVWIAFFGKHLDENGRIVTAYLVFNIAFVAVIGNLFEAGENHRFRFLTDPMYVIILSLFIHYTLAPRISGSRPVGGKPLPSCGP